MEKKIDLNLKNEMGFGHKSENILSYKEADSVGLPGLVQFDDVGVILDKHSQINIAEN